MSRAGGPPAPPRFRTLVSGGCCRPLWQLRLSHLSRLASRVFMCSGPMKLTSRIPIRAASLPWTAAFHGEPSEVPWLISSGESIPSISQIENFDNARRRCRWILIFVGGSTCRRSQARFQVCYSLVTSHPGLLMRGLKDLIGPGTRNIDRLQFSQGLRLSSF